MTRSLAILLLAAAPALGQEPAACGPKETYGDCIDRLAGEAGAFRSTAAAAAGAVAAQASKKVAKKAAPEGAPDTAGAVRDFLPVFFSSLGLGGVKQDNNALTLTFNPALLQLGPDNPLSLQAVVRNPAVFDALVQALPKSIRAAQKSALEDQLQDFDDVELSLAWSRQSERFGRDAGDHRELLSRLFVELLQAAKVKVDTSASKALLNRLTDINLPPIENLTPETASPQVRAELDPLLAAAAREIADRQKALVDLAEQRRFFSLDDLVNNQPQILVSANYRRRSELVGPDATTAKVSFEMGFANVNGLERHCRLQDKPAPDDACVTSYLQEYGPTLKTSPRLKIEANYAETDKYAFALPEASFSYDLDRVHSLTGKATLGGFLRADALGNQTTRADLEAVYEDVSGDAQRNNRLVATLTFTQKLTDDMAATFSAVWANKPQYRGEVDKELGARFGLKYKIDRQQP